MSNKKKKQNDIKIPSAAQINKLLTTYRKNDNAAFRDIMMMAEARGIQMKRKTKYYSGAMPEDPTWISESKYKKAKVKKFYLQIYEKYGSSYSQYEKKRKTQYEKYKAGIKFINDTGRNITPLSYEEYKNFRTKRDELISEIYKVAYEINNMMKADGDKYDFKKLHSEVVDYSELDDESLALIKLQDKLDDLQNQRDNYGYVTADEAEE